MSLLTKIQDDIKYALKNKQEPDAEIKLSVLRLLLSAIKNKQIDLGRELTDKEIISVIQQAMKQREESIVQYKKAQRDALAGAEEREIVILKIYLPEELSRDQIETITSKVITLKRKDQAFALQPSNAAFGIVMRAVMLELDTFPDKIYNKSLLSEIIKEQLAK